MPKWTLEMTDAAVSNDWDVFNTTYPGFTNYNGWRRQRYEALQGRVAGYEPPRTSSGETIITSAGGDVLYVDQVPTLASPPVKDRPSYEVRADGDIFINYAARTIVTNLGEFGSVTMSFERHAQMRRRYANDWENSADTIPEVARDFDLHPKAFERYKSLHGWTHASDPFTDEEWAEGLDVDDAVEQTLESQRRAYHKKLQRERWKLIIDDAERWRRFEHSALIPMQESIAAHAPRYVPPVVTLASPAREFDLVLCPMDLHYGKGAGWADEVRTGYSRDEARALLIQKTERLLSAVTLYGRPRRIITAVGSDWFHIDTDQGTTTSGTPQDMDGTPHAILWEGSQLAITQIDMLRQIAPVDVYYCAGNHDRLLGWGLLYAVYAWFRNADNVTIHQSAAPRQYAVSGSTLIGFTHGDGPKPKDLPLLMAAEAADLWGRTKHRAWFTGHLHHELVRDTMGVMHYQLASLSGSDRWHERSGYVGARRTLAGYVVDAEEGVTATIYAPAH